MDSLIYGVATEQVQQKIAYLLCDSFSMLPFISSVETFRIANRRQGEPLYGWDLISCEGSHVRACNGMNQAVDYSVSDAPDYKMVMVCGPFDPREYDCPATSNWLKRQAENGALLGGIESGGHVLAKAGLLDGHDCTTHWENMHMFVQDFPQLNVTNDVYEFDGQRITCAGGGASLDMALFLIEQQYGHELAAKVTESTIHPQIRTPGEPQRMALKARIGTDHPVLLECIELMEANIEEPLAPNDLATLIKVSKRQLERLFQRYLNNTPCRYYLGLRLDAANEMLKVSSKNVLEIALACGFKSPGHFSSCFQSRYGTLPKSVRQ